MQGADQLGSLVNGIQALVTLAVGICTIVALNRKQPPVDVTVRAIEDAIREKLGDLRELISEQIDGVYCDVKKNHNSVMIDLKDHEGRIGKLEGTCQSRNSNGSSCVKQ
jgi:apolipoprotein N-acyltransferase